MRKIILYSAISIDGKIARPDGDVKWLDEIPVPEDGDYGYSNFYQSIDTTLMGNNTYGQIKDMGVDFPYPEKKNYVFTRSQELISDENVKYINANIIAFIEKLKSEPGADIWLVGGGQINTLLLNARLIDELILFIMPVLLGKGILLFEGSPVQPDMRCSHMKEYPSGVVQLNYNLKYNK